MHKKPQKFSVKYVVENEGSHYKQHNVCTKYYHELLQEIASH